MTLRATTLAAALFAALLAASPGASLAAPVILDVAAVSQEHDQWCWAATCRAALLHFGVDQPQCALAEFTRTHSNSSEVDLGTTDCCVDATAGCNHWNWFWNSGGSVEELLAHFGAVQNNTFDRPLALEEVQRALDVGRLVVVRWAWANGSGHFLLVHGYDESSAYYMDPWPGEGLKIGEYDWMVSGGTHAWATSLTTGRPSTVCSDPGRPCDDGDRCTLDDACSAPVCAGTPRKCTAPVCQRSLCDPASGECAPAVFEPDGASCDDQDPCTTGDACLHGACEGAARQCPAAECLAGSCVRSAGGCVQSAVADGTACRGGTCRAGACTPSGCSTAGGGAPALVAALALLGVALCRRPRPQPGTGADIFGETGRAGQG